METCVCSALNFYARHCTNLKLKNICRLNGGHELFSWELEPITSIPQTTLTICPSAIDNNVLEHIDFGTLAKLSPGFYHPTHTYNNSADVIGILNVKNNPEVKRLILFIQLKDWFKDTLVEKVDGAPLLKNIVDEWRWAQQFVATQEVFLKRTNTSLSQNRFAAYWENYPTHKYVFIIFSANRIDSISEDGKFLKQVFFTQTTQSNDDHLRFNEATMDLG